VICSESIGLFCLNRGLFRLGRMSLDAAARVKARRACERANWSGCFLVNMTYVIAALAIAVYDPIYNHRLVNRSCPLTADTLRR
jgi:hypothetical protein